jgi:hypothetical protein
MNGSPVRALGSDATAVIPCFSLANLPHAAAQPG